MSVQEQRVQALHRACCAALDALDLAVISPEMHADWLRAKVAIAQRILINACRKHSLECTL
jgi:hypothetical protein